MSSKYEWRKSEKETYLIKSIPQVIQVPPYKFLTIEGACNPESEEFVPYITALYSVSYAIKMTLKKADQTPKGYTDYTVYPLEGVWSLTEEAIKTYDGTLNKDDLVFKLMLRQPEFIAEEYVQEMISLTERKKPQKLLSKLKYETIEDGMCVQMMHLGSFDSEPESFEKWKVSLRSKTC